MKSVDKLQRMIQIINENNSIFDQINLQISKTRDPKYGITYEDYLKTDEYKELSGRAAELKQEYKELYLEVEI
jgi:hypothetical protein